MSTRVRATIGGRTFARVARATVRRDVLELAATWSLTLDPVDDSVLAVARVDAEVRISVDGQPLVVGYVDEREVTGGRGGRAVVLTGRDKAGRLVDEAMPFGRLADLDLVRLGQLVAGPWFGAVLLSNAANRNLIRGRGTKVPGGAEPIFARAADAQLRVEAGQTRAEVLRSFLAPARLLAWSSADGNSLIIGQPNRQQRPQFLLDARRAVSVADRRSVAERGATYAGYRTATAPSVGNARLEATAADTRGDFQRAKALAIVASAARNREQLRKELDAEVARRNQQAQQVTLEAIGFGERYSVGVDATLFAPDTVARVNLPTVGTVGDFQITAVTFNLAGRDSTTEINLLPVDVEVF